MNWYSKCHAFFLFTETFYFRFKSSFQRSRGDFVDDYDLSIITDGFEYDDDKE